MEILSELGEAQLELQWIHGHEDYERIKRLTHWLRNLLKLFTLVQNKRVRVREVLSRTTIRKWVKIKIFN